MADPYEVLDLPGDADDATIRARYLELVRRYSPEHQPERFAAVRAAYESLRDLDTRLRHQLFEAGQRDTIDAILEEIECQSPRRRLSLATLLNASRRP